MFLLSGFTTKIFRIIRFSYKGIHVFLLILSLIFYALYYYFGSYMDPDSYLGILNSIGILSTFFLLAIEKIDYQGLRNDYKSEVKFGRDSFSEGQILVNTFFSMLIVEVLLLGLQYILFIFNFQTQYFLFLSILYMISGFIIVVGTWHGRESKKF